LKKKGSEENSLSFYSLEKKESKESARILSFKKERIQRKLSFLL